MKKGVSNKKNIRVNAVLNVVRLVVSNAFSLITYPYALRVLGADGIGKVNYSNSIVNYFILLGMFGVNIYAVREGAKYRSNKQKLNCFVSEVFSINIITALMAYGLLIVMSLGVAKFRSHIGIIFLQSINIALVTTSVDYVNVIFEDYYLLTVRSIITRVISFILLFVLVRTPNDFYRYALLHVLPNGIVAVSNWYYCQRYVHLHVKFNRQLLQHIKPMMTLFANNIATTIYVSSDMTMLGWIKGDYHVGLYTAAVNVYNIFKNLFAAMHAVAVPQLSESVADRDERKYKKVISEISSYVILLAMPVTVGLICLSPEIMMYMGGKEYTSSVLSLQILAVALFFAIISGVITSSVNVTLGREKDNLIATLVSATINLVMNAVLIPRYGIYGAATTTLLSEAFVFLFCFIRIPEKGKYFDYGHIKKAFIHSIASVLILPISVLLRRVISHYIPRMICVFILSVVVYVAILIVVKDENAMQVILGIRQKVLNREKQNSLSIRRN